MKIKLFTLPLIAIIGIMLSSSIIMAQDVNIVLQSGNYNLDPYPSYSPTGSVTGTYSIKVAKSTHTFTNGQFTINVAFPPGAVYAGGASLPAEFTVTTGATNASFVVISITSDWSGTGPTAIRTLVLPIKIVGSSIDQPTGTTLQWLDPFTPENSSGNSTGSPLNVSAALPVTLNAFSVSREDQTSLLSWSTTSEANSDRFDIEHSLNAKNWNLLSSVNSKGESSILEKYSYVDTDPSKGENFYRLKMIDRDGTFAYSRIQSITFDGTLDKSMIYPNPASDYLKLNVSDLRKIKSIKIYDLNGRAVYTAAGNGLTKTIDIKKVSTGLYVVEVVSLNGEINTSKISIFK
ncbi:T9SS type A sorting domain-containing protein [Dyadobacter sp. 3J3]|uniref:T9SS type A sorting domain-containing protein n=1 Tax=Dyadobacter sp. 3J3 TaxID=2606600 RepID=UPI00135A5EF7|nr:T9SS type A sorting domain-containing protein [Dyadobacter sp. 3J3]